MSRVFAGNYSEYIAFAPYWSKVFDCRGELKIEVTLTRRNTFGPLHYAPIYAAAYGPEIFVQKENFTENYTLIEQGVSEKIHIEICKSN